MPSRNVEKICLQEAYYHVYNRGVNKRRIFLDAEDYSVFLNLLKRYLDKEPVKDKQGREYPWLYNKIELLAFCLMPNHFHLLVYQNDAQAMTLLLRGVSVSYSTYFNKKYHRVGPLFQETYRASMITTDAYLQHISRYIHLNPKAYETWEFSSLPYYLGKKSAAWIRPNRILEVFNGRKEYRRFVADYVEHKKVMDGVKIELANYNII